MGYESHYMDNKLFSFRMIQEQLRKSKRYTYTHVYIIAEYVHTILEGGGGGGWGGGGGNDGTSDIEKQG